MTLSYDASNPRSIEQYAQRLVGRSLRDVLAQEAPTAYQTGKGNLGDVVERSYFGVNPGNVSAPDFLEADVELKTTPVWWVRKRLRAKERLVLQMIDYFKVHEETWETSSFLSKNRLLLILFYLWERDVDPLDYTFKIARLWSIPPEDLEIIRDDWETIVRKIREGRAHELSEGDTLYLSACTKGSKGANSRRQPFSDEPAKRRAFSLKASYMNSVIEDSLKPRHAASVDDLRAGKTFEQVVHERFAPYIGMTANAIADELAVTADPKAKNYYAVLTKKLIKPLLGFEQGERIAEFEKADIIVRTMRLQRNGTPKESVSFPAFDYSDLVGQEWEDSDLRQDLAKRYLFVVYQLDAQAVPALLRTQFWTMPVSDIEQYGRECFERTVELVLAGRTDDLPRSTQNKVCHVRPHGLDSSDTIPTPTGGMEVRKSFWLNRRYLGEQLVQSIDA